MLSCINKADCYRSYCISDSLRPVVLEQLSERRDLPTHLLLLFLLLGVIATLLLFRGLGLLSPDTAGTPTTERRGEGEVDVLLRVETDDERRNVHNLLADAASEVSTTSSPPSC